MSDRLRRQIEYYSARAPEYDDWFYRRDRYDLGEAHTDQWQREVQQIRDQLQSGGNPGRILELAPGTGIWTQELLNIGDRVTALDASPAMIAINRAKLQSGRVEYRLTDLFAWRPTQAFDMVFFGFWLSHVPAAKLDGFLAAVHAALKPGGRLFFVDSQQVDSAGAATETENLGADVQKRVLKDGRRFDIVKIYYEPAKLSRVLRRQGFDIEVRATPTFFIYADGVKAG